MGPSRGSRRSTSVDKKLSFADERKKEKRPTSEGAVNLASLGSGPTSRYVGMTGGIPGTGLRGKAPEMKFWGDADNGEDGERGRSSVGRLDDYTSPAYVRATYRAATVKVGPPYNLGLTPTADSGLRGRKGSLWIKGAQWTAEEQDKQDWAMSYASTEKKQPIRLGPDCGIRGMGQAWNENLENYAAPPPEPEAKPQPLAKTKAKGHATKPLSGAPGTALRKQVKGKGLAVPKGHRSHRGRHGMTDSDTS